MGYRVIELNLPTDFDEQLLQSRIRKELRIANFSYEILNQALDARNKKNIHWQVSAGIFSKELKTGELPREPELIIPFRKRDKKVLVVGSGPAGFFSAYILLKAGFSTTILERGAEVYQRATGIHQFEKTGVFDPVSNYAFGEGGAGTFSDGKLTSRSKKISLEKRFILNSYIRAGAPAEIGYLTHPHVGSDNLKVVVKTLRQEFIDSGGTILFETFLEDMLIKNQRVESAMTTSGILDADIFMIAPGHSSFETYKMLIDRGIPFRTKNFALGFRAEHPQELINLGQWGCTALPGVKAAEYRLTSNREGRPSVFSFCMCPGGTVVPATPYAGTNIVNGMSLYQRNGYFANAACVAAIHPGQLAGHALSATEALDQLKSLEEQFFAYSKGYSAPYCTIQDFIKRKSLHSVHKTSYPLGLIQAPLWEMLPPVVVNALSEGLTDFSGKLKGYEKGILLGLESKTSSPIQVLRDETGKVEGFDNLYMTGEGSGYAGGIISSAADGIRSAMAIAESF
jgi:uncharacterized protein